MRALLGQSSEHAINHNRATSRSASKAIIIEIARANGISPFLTIRQHVQKATEISKQLVLRDYASASHLGSGSMVRGEIHKATDDLHMA